MANDIERRDFTVDTIKVETRAEGDAPVIAGYAAVFNSASVDIGWKEIIAPGAFTESVRSGDVFAYFNHNRDVILGRTKSGTLKLSEDARGLAIEVTPPSHRMDVVELIERGDVTGMSFGFRTRDQRWTKEEDGTVVRTLLDVDLIEVSPVTHPAYPDTSVALRSLEAWREEIRAPGASLAIRRKRLDLAAL